MSTRPRVLLADDYPEMVKAVGRLLALHCEVVGSVADGSALLEAAHRLQPDVIVLDVNLPNVHSLEACREITRAHPKVKVVMFTALTDANVSQAFLAGRSRRLRIETIVRRPAVDHPAFVYRPGLTRRS